MVSLVKIRVDILLQYSKILYEIEEDYELRVLGPR